MTVQFSPDGGEIRQATRADLLDVYRIEKVSFEEPWPFAAFERFLGKPGFLVATFGEEIAGYIVADIVSNYGRNIGHIKDIAVRPDTRGQGLGRQLLKRALVTLSIDGANHVKLEVRESNDPARHLYHDVGFQPLRRVSNYYEDGEDALIMVLDLQEWRQSVSTPE